MIQPGRVRPSLDFQAARGPSKRERCRDTKSIRVIYSAPPSGPGSISPNSASISRARSPVAADPRKRIFIALIVTWEKRATGENSSPAPDVLSPMEFLSFSTSLSVSSCLSFRPLHPSSYLLYFPRLDLHSSVALRNDSDGMRILVIRFGKNAKTEGPHASENTRSVG